jgi:short-subunit dehydrogenase
MTINQVIWILGASQGIGRDLAKALHAEGQHLILSARSESSLQELAEELGDRCEVRAVDVTQSESLLKTAEEIFQYHGRLDSAVYLAATYHPMAISDLDVGKVEQTLRINLQGAFNFIQAVFPEMKRRKAGQIVLVGSVAGYGGLPKSQPYAATKAAMINLAESLYLEARGSGVDIKLVSPGFVRTRLTDKNDFKMPAIIEPQQAAKEIVRGMKARKFEIHFPKRFTRLLKLLQLLPYGLYFKLVGGGATEEESDKGDDS